MHIYIYEGFPKLGVPFWGSLWYGGPYGKGYSTLGSILGPPYFGKLPYVHIHIFMANNICLLLGIPAIGAVVCGKMCLGTKGRVWGVGLRV